MVSAPDLLERVRRAAVDWATELELDEWALSLLVVAVGWYVSHLLVRLLGRRVARRFQRPSVTKSILRSVKTAVLFISIGLAASIHGVRASNLLLSVTVFSAVLGLVLAPLIGSFINGIFILADQPYEIGDMIELVDENRRGFVEDITIRYTKIFTLDNSFLVIPNATMRERDVINYSAEDERSRFSYEMGVTYEGDLDEARALMERAAREVPDIIDGGPDIRIGSARYPAEPVAYITEFGDHGVLLELRYWVKTPYKLGSVRSQLQENIWKRLPDADVEIPYPHSHVVFDETSGRAAVDVTARDWPPRAGTPDEADD